MNTQSGSITAKFVVFMQRSCERPARGPGAVSGCGSLPQGSGCGRVRRLHDAVCHGGPRWHHMRPRVGQGSCVFSAPDFWIQYVLERRKCKLVNVGEESNPADTVTKPGFREILASRDEGVILYSRLATLRAGCDRGGARMCIPRDTLHRIFERHRSRRTAKHSDPRVAHAWSKDQFPVIMFMRLCVCMSAGMVAKVDMQTPRYRTAQSERRMHTQASLSLVKLLCNLH